jgi:quercetin dioxygenase-like cupin family protein
MATAFKLPFTFDSIALKSDLQKIGLDEWVPHFNPQYYEGLWSGVSLRSVNGSASQLFADPARSNAYADTPVLDSCCHIKEVLETFKCFLETVRLLKLGPGSRIHEHSDFDLGERYGVVRFHIPIQTNPETEFYLGGQRIEMNEGEGWYLDLSLPHRVENNGETDRVHLVIDCVVNEWVRSLIK